MGISKTHAHPRQPFHLRGVQLNVIGVAGEILIRTGITHPHVISHKEDDVGLTSRTSGQRSQAKNQKETDHAEESA